MENRVRESLERMIDPTAREDDNLGYALHQGTDDPAYFALYEGWTSEDALNRHMQTPHFKQLVEELKETLAEPLKVSKVKHIGGEVPAPG